MASGKDPAETSEILNRDLQKISYWAQNWKVKFYPKKSKDMIFSNKNLNNSQPLIFNDTYIERVNVHKHLGVCLTSNLDWSYQINESCLKANRKLSVLRSVKYLKRKTLDLLYKVTVRSVIDYALPIYGNTLKILDLNRLEQLQYRAAKLVTGSLNFTSRDRLNEELGWESIRKRIDYLGLNIFHKIHVRETRPLLTKCLTKWDWKKQHNLRSKGGYLPYPNYGFRFSNSFFPYISKIWNNLPKSTQSLSFGDFKTELKISLKPIRIRHYNVGQKYSNSFLTRIRTGRTNLNQSRYTIGLSEMPNCLCHAPNESSEHYLLDCFLYSAERQTLFNLAETIIPNFKRISKKGKFNILTRGLNSDNPEYYHTNRKISLAVQNFILKTKRFID